MSLLISLLLIVEVIAAFLLVVVILAQKSKDQGLGMAFGGGMGESLFGSRAGNVLTRMTITLAVIFMVNTILLGILFSRGAAGTGSVMDRADRAMPVAPAVPMGQPGAAPMMPADGPMMPAAMPVAASAPIVMQMDESGELVTVDMAPDAMEVVSEPVAVPAPEAVVAAVEDVAESVEAAEAAEIVEAVDADIAQAEEAIEASAVEVEEAAVEAVEPAAEEEEETTSQD